MRSEGGFDYLSAEEMAEADRRAIEVYHIDVLSLMENAGAKVADVARTMLDGDVEGRRVCCLAGKGNNGGDGLVAARHLHNWGAEVTVVLGAERGELRSVPAKQLGVVEELGISVGGPEADFSGVELLVDALLGYGAKGDPKEPIAGLIRRANASRLPVLAVDVPSGFDATTGRAYSPCMAAKATVTFGYLKTGFLGKGAAGYVGELFLADISLPRGAYPGARSEFGRETIVRVR
jgi:NAD(P)H-hydrate epimerase